jgi:hypothetical protein
VRAARPGSIETLEQEQAIHDYARRVATRTTQKDTVASA